MKSSSSLYIWRHHDLTASRASSADIENAAEDLTPTAAFSTHCRSLYLALSADPCAANSHNDRLMYEDTKTRYMAPTAVRLKAKRRLESVSADFSPLGLFPSLCILNRACRSANLQSSFSAGIQGQGLSEQRRQWLRFISGHHCHFPVPSIT